MTVQVVFHEQVTLKGEITVVPKGDLRTALDRLKQEPTCGKPLRRPLLGCRSIRVGGSENRLVYEILSAAGEDPIIVLVLSIERRRASEVYDIAAARR